MFNHALITLYYACLPLLNAFTADCEDKVIGGIKGIKKAYQTIRFLLTTGITYRNPR